MTRSRWPQHNEKLLRVLQDGGVEFAVIGEPAGGWALRSLVFSLDIRRAQAARSSRCAALTRRHGCADGLVCVDVFGAGGLSPTRCSECGPETPCPAGQGCVLNTDDGLLDAYLDCIDPGTVPLGGTCPVVDGAGDGTTCQSGECGVISVLGGAIEIGVCSECDADGDCPMGQSCSPPDFAMGMLSPGTCG